MAYQKVRFSLNATTTDPDECTAGLVLVSDVLNKMSVTDVSKLFPMSEAPKMRGVLQVSKKYKTWGEAFNHQFHLGD